MDYSDKKTEAELRSLEKKLNRLYKRAWNEMRLETEEYFEQFAERYHREYEKYKAGAYTEQQFKAWYQAQVARGKTWEARRDSLAMKMTKTDEIAAAYINDTTPSIFALNANYVAYMTEQNYDVTFTLVNENTIRNLVTEKSNAIEFKTVDINPTRDYLWNSKQIQSALISGILTGQPIGKLADAFMAVQKRNRNAAIRNARTSVTSAQNAGRIDTMRRSRDMGIDTKKEWLSAHDGRVRDSHAALNGQIRDIDEAFDNGLQYPADPEGAPSEVYNCRCTLKYVYPKYMSKKSNELYSETKRDNETYQEWLERKKSEEPLNLTYPRRPRKQDYSDYDAYQKARERYKRDKAYYEAEKGKIIQEQVKKAHVYTERELQAFSQKYHVILDDNLSNVDDRVLGIACDSLKPLFEKYPEVEKSFADAGSRFRMVFREDGDALMSANGGLRFHRITRDANDFLDTAVDMQAGNYLRQGDGTARSLVVHEFGHNVDLAFRKQFYTEDYNRDSFSSESWLDYIKRRDYNFNQKNLYEKELADITTKYCDTDYAHESIYEAFAEGFVEMETNPNSEYGKVFTEFFKKWRADT